MQTGDWNILEVAKLVTSVLGPLTVAGIGIYIHRITKRFENAQWRSQKLTEKRLAIYDEMAPLMNDVLCYFTFVGCWKDLEPPQVVALKRTIDKKMYLAAPLFSKEFFSACMTFQNLCFQTFSGWRVDARLKTSPLRRIEHQTGWPHEWGDYFSEVVTDPADIKVAYRQVMNVFATDIGVNPNTVIPPTGRIPANHSRRDAR